MGKYDTIGLPWHSGLGTDVTDCVTAQDVMKKAGLDYSVKKCELVAEMPFSINSNNLVVETRGEFVHDTKIYRPCPNAYATYRTDENVPLGIVKEKYEVVQNIDAFTFFNDAIGEDKALWQTAGVLGYGERIFVSAKLPIKTSVNGDPIDNYLVFSNSHDGSTSINIMFTPIRVFCTNMLNAALNSSDCFIRLRHTKSVKDKLEFGAKVLASAIEYSKSAEQLYNSISAVTMKEDDALEFIVKLILSDEEYFKLINHDDKNGFRKILYRDYRTIEVTGISTKKINQICNMFDYYNNGVAQEDIKGTAWGVYNGVTGYYSNVVNLGGQKRFDSLLYGGANRTMMKALNGLVALAA